MINNYDVKKIFLNNIKKNSIIIDLNRILEKKDINILKRKKLKDTYFRKRGYLIEYFLITGGSGFLE